MYLSGGSQYTSLGVVNAPFWGQSMYLQRQSMHHWGQSMPLSRVQSMYLSGVVNAPFWGWSMYLSSRGSQYLSSGGNQCTFLLGVVNVPLQLEGGGWIGYKTNIHHKFTKWELLKAKVKLPPSSRNMKNVMSSCRKSTGQMQPLALPSICSSMVQYKVNRLRKVNQSKHFHFLVIKCSQSADKTVLSTNFNYFSICPHLNYKHGKWWTFDVKVIDSQCYRISVANLVLSFIIIFQGTV